MSSKKVLSVIILLVGVALIIAPFGYKMFDRASAGADMMKAFEPVLTRPNVTTFQEHMQTFGGMQQDINKMIPALAQQMGITQDQLNQMLGQQFPGVANGMKQMDKMGQDFSTVINVMDQNVENFQKADQLPMRTMPWFFILAGGALVVLAGAQLLIPEKK
ncbi:MAG: hypothetical protein M1539_00640 [Actinobacteria bacterium]|nr:hypothetical protein [Actinomycetota bacterium]MCL5882485.1 hypothetical protein [Actinomycetota bacterium]